MMRPFLGALLLALGCGQRHIETPIEEPHDPRINSLAGLPGEPCGTPLMVTVTRADGTHFCIDRFEATLDGGALGNARQAADTAVSTDGTTQAKATVALGVTPVASVSWFQAKAACQNVQKRLCTVNEWERACRGPSATLYPYGEVMDDKACNGFFNYAETNPEVTGSLDSCGSAFGVYDLSGNLEEWLENAVERTPGTGPLDDRAVRGGSFKSNSHALACVGPEFHEAPATSDVDRGFRCCQDAP